MSQVRAASQTFKVRDAASYDPLALEFQRFTEQVTGPLAARMVALAHLTPGDSVLDVGTGTGIVALKAARQLGPDGKVLGVDLSDGMMTVARERTRESGLAAQVDFRKMDAEDLDLPDQSFDVVTSLFALLHFPDPLVALRGMFRVLRPGGRLVVAVGSGPQRFSFSGVVEGFRRVHSMSLERRGRRLTAPGFLDSLVNMRLPEPNEEEESSLAAHSKNRAATISQLVRSAGFADIKNHWQGHQAVIDSPEEFWEMQRTFSSIARKRLSGVPSEKSEEVRYEFLSRSRLVQAAGGKLVYPFAAFFVSARRPPN
jgi:ubiquinone/menaquinone biosynthesis C-methylase UbiE